MAEQNNGIAYFVVGLGIGVAVGLLDGSEVRRRDAATDSNERSGRGIRIPCGLRRTKARNSSGGAEPSFAGFSLDLIDRSKEAIARQKEQLAMAVEAGKGAYRESVDDGSPAL